RMGKRTRSTICGHSSAPSARGAGQTSFSIAGGRLFASKSSPGPSQLCREPASFLEPGRFRSIYVSNTSCPILPEGVDNGIVVPIVANEGYFPVTPHLFGKA